MVVNIKATGFSLTPALRKLAEEKILKPLTERLGKEFPPDLPLDIELAKTTRHHNEGKIWKCEVNLSLPHERRTLYVEVLGESLEAAIDEAKDELEREVGEYKEKRMTKFLRAARRLKDRLHLVRWLWKK